MEIKEAVSIVKNLVELNRNEFYVDEIQAFQTVIDAAESYDYMNHKSSERIG